MKVETTDMPRPENTAIRLQPVVTDHAPRCWQCRRKLAGKMSRPWEIICQKCNALNASAPG